MALQLVTFGTPPSGIGGDSYKTAFEKCNLNFTELYKEVGTVRTINGVSFNDTANIIVADSTKLPLSGGTLTGPLTAPTFVGELTGNATTASKLKASVSIHGVAFDGSKDINLPTFSTASTGLVPARSGSTTTKFLREDGTWVVPTNTNTTYTAMTSAEAVAGTATTGRLITPVILKEAITTHAPTPAVFATSKAGLVPARTGSTTTKFLREDGTWVTPTNTTYSSMSAAEAKTGTVTTARSISAATLKSAVEAHAPDKTQYLGTQQVKAIQYNAQTIYEDVEIPFLVNALSAGPITIDTNVTVTIPEGSNWTIV